MSEALKEEIQLEPQEDKDVVAPIIVPNYVDDNKKKKKKRKNIFKRKGKKQLDIPDTAGKNEKKKKRKEKVLRQTPYILPFLRLEEDCIYLKDGVMDMYQIETKDLYSLNESDINNLIHFEARFLRSYGEAFKEVALNFPANTDKQTGYWLKKRNQTNDPLRLKFIDRKIFELDFIARERSNREFLMFIYAANEQQLNERKKQMIRASQSSFPLKPLSKDKKQDILYLLLNQNSKL